MEQRTLTHAEAEIIELKMEVSGLKQDVQELRSDIKELVAAWNTAQGLTSFVKWSTGVLSGLGVLYYFVFHGKWPT